VNNVTLWKEKMTNFKDSQYNYIAQQKIETLGVMSSNTWKSDPKRLGFTLARYKFVSKMLAGFDKVLEVGCGDAWASRVVKQTVNRLIVSDYDQSFIDGAKAMHSDEWPMEYMVHDFLNGPSTEKFDAIYLLDVFEHISPSLEMSFLRNIKLSLVETGVCIIGCPSLQSQDLIPLAKRDPGHINCKTGEDLRLVLSKEFSRVFLFGMNDENIHVSNSSMNFYNLCMCTA
jgi:2-polyprenyl-3-methyl-5-hydroxy-6-metoxy-1,4-benzoquinol methylase